MLRPCVRNSTAVSPCYSEFNHILPRWGPYTIIMSAFIASLFTALVSGVPAIKHFSSLRAQKRAARLILQGDCSTPSVSLFSTLHWIPVCDIIKNKKLQLLFSILLNPEARLCLKEKFSFVFANSAHMTRGATSNKLRQVHVLLFSCYSF